MGQWQAHRWGVDAGVQAGEVVRQLDELDVRVGTTHCPAVQQQLTMSEATEPRLHHRHTWYLKRAGSTVASTAVASGRAASLR